MAAVTTATSALPLAYRIALLYLEPFFALSGAVLVYINPGAYVSTMSRSIVTRIDPGSHFVYTELAGAWLYFAFIEAVVLRAVDDLKVWRLLGMAMLISDFAYTHSVAQAVGGWSVWLDVPSWGSDDWVAFFTTWTFVFIRLAIVFGIGVRSSPTTTGAGGKLA